MRKYSFSQRVINEWNKLPNDYVNASSVYMFKNRIQISYKGGLHIDEKIVGLSISQWRPCPLAIWNLLFGMTILLNQLLLLSIVQCTINNNYQQFNLLSIILHHHIDYCDASLDILLHPYFSCTINLNINKPDPGRDKWVEERF